MNHYVGLLILAVCIAVVFTLIAGESKEERLRYFVKLTAYMALGSFVAAWTMYAIA